MMGTEDLARVIKDCQTKHNELTDMVYGVVTNTNPLTIRVDNRFSIAKKHLILSQMVRNLSVSFTVTIEGKTGSGSSQVFSSLQTGDQVRMLRVGKGQKYYVLERG